MMHQKPYSSIQKTLHWLLAFLIIMMLLVGFSFDFIPKDMAFKAPLRNAHKVIGIGVLCLVCLRIYLRLLKRPTVAPIPRWMQHASHLSHVLLYLMMIGMPLSGWIMSTAAQKMPPWFHVFLPGVPVSKALASQFYNVHSWMSWLLAAVIIIHITATLLHVLRKEPVLARMLFKRS